MADRTIQIIIDTNDRATGNVKAIAKGLLELDKTAARLSNRFKSFATQKYMATLALIDRVTEPGNRINALLKKIAGGTWRVSLGLADGALGGIRKIESALMRLTNRVYNIKTNMAGNMGGLMSGAMMGAGVFAPVAGMAGVGFGVSNAISAYADFEKQMSRVQAIRQLDKNSAEMQAIVQQAKELGATTAWTRKQVGEAQEYMALAGWSTQQILAGTPHILNLASAGGIETKPASDIVTDAMTAFQLKPEETYINKQGNAVNAAEHFIDMLAKMQAVSNTDILQAGEAFNYAAAGIGAMYSDKDIQTRMQATEDAMIMIALQANAGFKGSRAGTGVLQTFNRIASMNANAERALGMLGVAYKDDNGDMLLPGEIIRNLSRKVKEGVDPNELLNFAEEISGEKIHAQTRRKLESFIEQTIKNGGKIGSADLMKLGSMIGGAEHAGKVLATLLGDWDDMAAKMDNVQGTAADMANTMLDNLAGSFTILGSAWDNFQQNLMEGTAGEGLRDFVNTLTELVNRADKLFSDGIQIGDFGKLIGDVIDRLKSKFLELDGIGSILAGGALMAGLTKIFRTAQKALGVLRGVQSGTSSVGGASAAKVGTMNVSAGVVNVNGKVAGGAGGAGGSGGRKVGNTSIIDNYNRTKERIRGGTPPPPPAPSRFAGMGSAAAGGAAFAGIFGLMDVFAVRAQNAERLAQAAPEERAQIIKENRAAELETNTGAVGSVVGAAIGAGLGSLAGPMGTAIGGVVGGMIGDALGRFIGREGADNQKPQTADVKTEDIAKHLPGYKPADYSFGTKQPTLDDYQFDWGNVKPKNISRDWTPDLTTASAAVIAESEVARAQLENLHQRTADFTNQFATGGAFDFYQQRANDLAQSGGDFFSRAEAGTPTAEQFATEGQVVMPEIIPPETSALDEFCAGVAEKFGALMESAGEIFSGLGETLGAGLEVAASMATGALDGIQSAFSSAKETICAAWSELPGFFEGVFSGLGGAAAAAGSAIYSGLTSVIGGIIGAWESAAGTISGIISSIAAAGASVGSSVSATVSGVIARVTGHAEGGLITQPELAVVGEKGPELILPLSDPARTNELLQQTFGDSTPQNISVDNSSGAGVNVTLNANFTINGGDNVLQTIQDNLQELADKFAAQMSTAVGASFNNRAL